MFKDPNHHHQVILIVYTILSKISKMKFQDEDKRIYQYILFSVNEYFAIFALKFKTFYKFAPGK